MYILALVILLPIAVLVAWFWLSLLRTSRASVPYVPSDDRAIAAMLELAKIQPVDLVVDLGSGDGCVAVAVAQAGATVDGYEIQRLLVWWSRVRAMWQGVAGRTQFFCADLWSVDCSGYDVVIAYALPELTPRLSQKLRSELRPGARVLSNKFAFPDWNPVAVKQDVYLYCA